jgi:hypothetical protein
MGSRKNKSERAAEFLDNLHRAGGLELRVAGRGHKIPLPDSEEFKKIANHIRFLEMICTGLSYADRRTISKLQRRVNTLEAMVERRDEKIRWHKHVVKETVDEWKVILEHKEEIFRQRLEEARKITPEQAHKIEANFVKNLKTNYEIECERRKAMQHAYAKGMKEHYLVYDSATNSRRWLSRSI